MTNPAELTAIAQELTDEIKSQEQRLAALKEQRQGIWNALHPTELKKGDRVRVEYDSFSQTNQKYVTRRQNVIIRRIQDAGATERRMTVNNINKKGRAGRSQFCPAITQVIEIIEIAS